MIRFVSMIMTLLAYVLFLTIFHSSYFSSSSTNNYNFPLRGVNIGGWLVIEPWLKVSWFNHTYNYNNESVQPIDEFTLTTYLGPTTATTLIQEHYATYFTEKDMDNIVKAGFNTLRIPVPYWMIDIQPGEIWVNGSLPYLIQALQWAYIIPQ